MTINGGQPHKVGDKGQRFEVTYKDPHTKTRRVFGWTETVDGYIAMVESIHLNPSMTDPKVEDRTRRTGWKRKTG